jgi:hypothetical protein
MGLRQSRFWRVVRWPLAVLVGLFVLIQLVPYGWWHENPPVVQDAPWPDAESRRIARESCYACHSNETEWPVYGYVAPMSWLVRSDVLRGRVELNFSDWAEYGDKADDAVEMVREGDMPLDRYTWIHRDAALTQAERDHLVDALMQMAGEDGDDNRGRGGFDDDDHSGTGSGG